MPREIPLPSYSATLGVGRFSAACEFVAELLTYFRHGHCLWVLVPMADHPTPDYPRVTTAVDRLTAVFLEMPGTRLSVDEAARLSGVDVPICGIILGALRDAGFLKQKPDGAFIRRGTDSPRS